jgi:predicted nucleic acid-binding protein
VIVVDASFALKLLLVEVDSPRAQGQWSGWTTAREIIVAPPLFPMEMASGLRKSVHRGLVAEPTADLAFDEIWRLGIEIREPARLHAEAWSIAKRFNRPVVYDSYYLALASILGCDLWTADLRLVNVVGQGLPWVRHLT